MLLRDWATMEKSEIVKKICNKLGMLPLKEEQVYKILYNFVDKLNFAKSSFSKSLIITEEQHKTLREVYDKSPVKKLYSYGFGIFGFSLNDIRVDVEPNHVKIIKK